MDERPTDKWSVLRVSGNVDSSLEVPSLASTVDSGYGLIRYALDPAGRLRVLVPCGPSGRLTKDESVENLLLGISTFDVSGKSVTFVDLINTNRGLDPVFAELTAEVVRRVDSGVAPVAAVEGTIADFRELLRAGARQEIPDSDILGLVGELIVLRSLVRVSPSAVSAWVGPFEQRHDFRRTGRSIEVKSSARADASRVKISSIEQLTEPALGSLTLVHVLLERSDAGALSVSSLCDDIVSHGGSREMLDRGLRALGCVRADAESWNRLKFELEAVRSYRVGPGFPRIVGADFGGSLPNGVLSVEYVVDLRTASNFLLSEKDWKAAIEGFVA